MGALRLIFVVNLCAGSRSSGAFYHANPTLCFACRLFYIYASNGLCITILCIYKVVLGVLWRARPHYNKRDRCSLRGRYNSNKNVSSLCPMARHSHKDKAQLYGNKISLCRTISSERVTSYNLFQGLSAGLKICIPV